MDNAKQQVRDEIGVQFGKYRVFARLATGGMAELFLAKQPGIGGFRKTIVLKCILPHLAKEEQFVQMFLDEARIAASLEHPNIVRILEIGEQVGVYFIAMEFIRGQSLREFRKRLYKQRPTKFSPYAVSAAILAQASAGLHYAHTAVDDDGYPLQIIHRDVSPTNILVSYNGVAKIVDFGVAKATTQQHRTSAGTIKGKYRYMSPEQIANKDLDNRSDIFSLGIILYEMTTNVGLFGRRSEIEVIKAVSEAQVMAPSKFDRSYPEALETIVMKALAKERDLRYNSADELRGDLEKFMHESGEYFGTAQLAELTQEFFPDEQRTDQTGIFSPLTPADLVRFAGEFASPDMIPNFQHPGYNSQISQPGWNTQHTGNFPPSYSQTTPASYQGMGPVAYQGGTPPSSASLAAMGRATHTPSQGHQSGAGMMAQMNLAHIQAGLPEDTGEETLAAGVPASPSLEGQSGIRSTPRSSGTRWLVLSFMLLLLLSGSAAGWWFFLRPNDGALEKQRLQIAALMDKNEHKEARMRLRIFEQMDGAHQKFGDWIQTQRQTLDLMAQLKIAEEMIKKGELLETRSFLQVLKKQTPNHPNILRLEQQITSAMAAARRPPPPPLQSDLPRTTPPPPTTGPDEEPEVRTSRRKRRRWRKPPKRRAKRAASADPVKAPETQDPAQPQQGKLYIGTTPSARVELNGQLIGYTPINNYIAAVGRYRLQLKAPGYKTLTRIVELRSDKPAEINASLEPLATDRPTPPPPTRRTVVATDPPQNREEEGNKPQLPFESIRLPRKVTLRIFMSDPRGIAGRHYTEAHPKLCAQIEAELKRVLGSNFPVSGVTNAWLRYVLEKGRNSTNDYETVHPRAVAYVAYKYLAQGRPTKRVGQILVSFAMRSKFQSLQDK